MTRYTHILVREEDDCEGGAACLVACLGLCLAALVVGGIALLVGSVFALYVAYVATVVPIVYASVQCYKAKKQSESPDLSLTRMRGCY